MDYGLGHDGLCRLRKAELVIHPLHAFLHLLAKVLELAVPGVGIVAAHRHVHAPALLTTALVAVFHRLRVAVALSARLAQVRPALEVPVGSLRQVRLHGVEIHVHRLGVPYAAAEFRPAFFQFALVMTVFPHAKQPVGNLEPAHAGFHAALDLPAGGAGTSHSATAHAATAPHIPVEAVVAAVIVTAVLGLTSVAHGEVKVPSRAKRHLAALAFLGLVQEETAPVGVGVVGHFFVQHVVERRSHVHIVFVPATVLAVLEQVLEIFQVFFQVGLLLLLEVLLLGVVHDDVQAVGGLEAFLVDVFVAHAAGIGAGLVECPDVAAGHVVAANVGFFKLAHVYAVFAAFDFFDKHVHAAVHAVDVEVEMLGAGAVVACLPKQPVGERVAHHALVNVRAMEYPIVGRGEPEHAYV